MIDALRHTDQEDVKVADTETWPQVKVRKKYDGDKFTFTVSEVGKDKCPRYSNRPATLITA